MLWLIFCFILLLVVLKIDGGKRSSEDLNDHNTYLFDNFIDKE